MERLGRPAGPVDDDGAIAENSTPESLVHADAFNLVEKQFERSDLENPGLQDDPLVRHRKLGGGPSRGSGNYGNDGNQNTGDENRFGQDNPVEPRAKNDGFSRDQVFLDIAHEPPNHIKGFVRKTQALQAAAQRK